MLRLRLLFPSESVVGIKLASSLLCGGARRPTYYGGNVDVSEKNFSYEKDYGPLLPSRYKNDPLLRCVFFSIMAIEDSNRPSGIRVLERMVFKFGAAKTTGIMQQKAERALSDEESVVLAFDYVEGMWDDFLRKFAKSRKKGGACSISFASDWYSYDYDLKCPLSGRRFFAGCYWHPIA